MTTQTTNEVQAVRGEKMVELRVKLWTNDIAESEGAVLPKHVWGAGMVVMTSNDAHGIEVNDPMPFNSMPELLGVIEDVLIESGIKMLPSRKMRRYMVEDRQAYIRNRERRST